MAKIKLTKSAVDAPQPHMPALKNARLTTRPDDPGELVGWPLLAFVGIVGS